MEKQNVFSHPCELNHYFRHLYSSLQRNLLISQFLQSGKIKPHRVNFFLGSALQKLFLRNKLSPAQLV